MPEEPDAIPSSAADAIGDGATLQLLQQLVAIAPTNLEDRATGRFEKGNFGRAADAIVRAARTYGLATRVYDPILERSPNPDLRGIPRPNVVVDLDVGATETVLVLAHYDVVPVPAEQRSRWKSPPHTLTYRADGRLYGRGANDDLGSGVVTTLLAMRRLADGDPPPRNVRLVACCDEETGGEGGVEAVKAHDALRPRDDPERILRADVALIPDGSPETTAGSSGVAFLDASFEAPVPLTRAVEVGRALVDLHELARGWRSSLPSPDWPDRHAPEPVVTGRATVTKFDWTDGTGSGPVRLLAAHAETDAANQVARCVTLVVAGPPAELDRFVAGARTLVPAPFRLEDGGATALSIPPGGRAFQLVGEACHGGYPHRGHNPVPPTLALLAAAVERGWLDGAGSAAATFTVDLRLIPEMELADGLRSADARFSEWERTHRSGARLVAPPSRCRSGYCLPVDHPAAQRLERILAETLGAHGIFGEYGGTDASALRDLTTPAGAPLPALVFGSMDPASHIHDAEESADPATIGGVARAIEQFVRGT